MVNLISAGRQKCGGCIVLIGLILIIPSILVWLTAEKVYGTPILDEKVTPVFGTTVNLTINGRMVIGNDYNIRIDYTIKPATTEEIANVSIKMFAVSTNATIASNIKGSMDLARLIVHILMKQNPANGGAMIIP